ncbi:MAG TPA: hypothetical protein VHO07_04745, partial [Streptosporangiaceae bacterium]|nr:hypothetical protein [Streptosporangiaceae bacterium]
MDHQDEQAEQEHGQMLGGWSPPDRLAHPVAQGRGGGAGLGRIGAWAGWVSLRVNHVVAAWRSLAAAGREPFPEQDPQ